MKFLELLIKIKDVEDIISEYKLISQYTIKKHFPNKIHIKLKETTLLAKLIKDKKKYFLADNNNLIPFADDLNGKNLPNIYGKDAEYYFNDFQKILRLNNFDLDIISSYYFFQINRWDLVTNDQKTIQDIEKIFFILERKKNNA